jgi:hypothetical protein
MRSPFLAMLVLFTAGLCIAAQQPKPVDPSGSPASAVTSSRPVSFTEMIKKTVAYVEVDYRDGTQHLAGGGTGFFVGYKDERLPEGQTFSYLVTNRHVAQPGYDEGTSFPVDRFVIRLNLREPANGEMSEKVEIPTGQINWTFPSDPTVDLAVTSITPSVTRYDFVAFPDSLLETKTAIKEDGISEGDSVLFAGYFTQFAGMKRFQPIIRRGTLAMMPDEPMPILGQLQNLYLADLHVFLGNSGSPLMVEKSALQNGRLTLSTAFPYKILGVVCGYIYENTDLELRIATTAKGTLKANSGVAAIVPADELRQLLDSPALKASRDSAVANFLHHGS